MSRRLSFALIVLFCLVSAAHAEMVSIARGKVNLRSGPGQRYAALWEMRYGYPLKVLARRDGWLKVTDFERDVGWVLARLVAKVPHMIVKQGPATIYSGPGERYGVVGRAERGVVFRSMHRGGQGWVRVLHESGMAGWVRREQLWGW